MTANQNDVIRWCVAQGLARSGRGNLKLPVTAKGERGKDGKLRVTMTTDSVDRHGDILEPAGAGLSAFRKSPRVQWAHDYTKPPIARAEQIAREGNAITCEIAWWESADANADHARFVREVREMYEHDPPFLNTWSIGFMPLEWTDRTETDADGNERFAGYHITRWELLELSAVPVPANPDAVSALRDAGIVTHKGLARSLGLRSTPETESGPRTRADSQAKQPAPSQPWKDAGAEALAERVRRKFLARLARLLTSAAHAELDRRMGRVAVQNNLTGGFLKSEQND